MSDKKFVEPQKLSYLDFPVDEEEPEGMKTVSPDLNWIFPDVQLNVVYANKSNMPLHLHIITPPVNEDTKDKRYPLIMWVQGSAFQKQSVEMHLPHMIDIAKQGYVIAMVEYRWAPDNPFPAQIKDLKTATRFMLRHANKYHVNPDKYLAWGESSGGHTVSLGVATENIQKYSDEDVKVEPLHYSGCIDFYGPTDISKMNTVLSTQNHVEPDSPEGSFLGSNNINEVPELVQAANPINYIEGNDDLPPYLIMHGNKDRLVPFNQSVLLFNALKKAHKQVDFYRINKSDHATDGFFEPESLKIILKFINDCFK